MFFSIQFYRTLAIILALLFVPFLAHSAGNIGLNFSQVIDDQSIGVVGEYEIDGNRADFEIDGQLQSGDIYRGKVHAELVFDVSAVDIKLFSDTTMKGYTLDGLGRDTNIGVALTVPVESLNFDIGIGGNSATPWGAPNALSELVPKGYDESELETLGLGSVHPAPRGIPFQDGMFLKGFVATGFKKGNVDIDIKGILQLTGEDKAHQVKTTFDTSRELFGSVTWNIGAEVILMTYQDEIHYEKALFTGFGYQWE